MAQASGQEPPKDLIVRVWKWTIGTWAGRLAGVALVVALVISLYWWPDSGFDSYPVNSNFQRYKTLWDWLALLGVPGVLAVGGYLFSRAERRNEKEIEALRTRQEREAADERAKVDRELANKRADEDRFRSEDVLRQALVQGYLDRMSELLLDKGLAASVAGDPVREVARARTLTVLRGLGEDGARKGYIVQFLYETALLTVKETVIELKGADLRKAGLNSVDLRGANLCAVDLSAANLRGASLRGANLSAANLTSAVLHEADLTRANVSLTNLSGADLSLANLREADLRGASLSHLNLSGANLSRANLRWADLTNAIVTDEQLAQSLSLGDATMPDSTRYVGVPPTTDPPSPDSTLPDA